MDQQNQHGQVRRGRNLRNTLHVGMGNKRVNSKMAKHVEFGVIESCRRHRLRPLAR